MLLLFGSVDSLVAPRPYYDENIRMTDMPGLENCMTMRYKLRFIGVRERKNYGGRTKFARFFHFARPINSLLNVGNV